MGHADTPAERAAAAVAIHCALVIEAAGEHCVAVKLQLACFERLGAAGWEAARRVAETAREHGLIVIADAKRGDIDVTAAAYGQAFFGRTETPFGTVESLGADALTVNPLLGRDSLAPLIAAAREHGGGVFVLTRTSNPGARDLQELELQDGGSLSERIARLVHELGAGALADAPANAPAGQLSDVGALADAPANAPAGQLSDVGAVVGATVPAHLARLRELMPKAVFLLPGVGAQGGRVEDLAPAFAPGIAGGLISASRGIVAAHQRAGGDPAAAAKAEAERLRNLAWTLVA